MNVSLKIDPARNDSINRIVHLARIIQRLNKFVTEDMGSELSLMESLLLYDLNADATKSVTELAAYMGLDKGTISRALKNLSDLNVAAYR